MLKAEEYKVSLWITAMPKPLSFAVHAWFVCEHGGIVDRIEVWAPFWVNEGESTIVHNALPPESGFRTSFFQNIESPKKRSKAKKIASIGGDINSVAFELYSVISKARLHYPYSEKYRMWPGPNSNTFIAWALAQVSGHNFVLPFNAFGKGYSISNNA